MNETLDMDDVLVIGMRVFGALVFVLGTALFSAKLFDLAAELRWSLFGATCLAMTGFVACIATLHCRLLAWTRYAEALLRLAGRKGKRE